MIYRVIEFHSLKELERLALCSHLTATEMEGQVNGLRGQRLGAATESGDTQWLTLRLDLC